MEQSMYRDTQRIQHMTRMEQNIYNPTNDDNDPMTMTYMVQNMYTLHKTNPFDFTKNKKK